RLRHHQPDRRPPVLRRRSAPAHRAAKGSAVMVDTRHSAAPAGRFARLRDSDILWSYRKSPVTIIASILVAVIVLASVFAPWITPQNPFDLSGLNLMDGFTPPLSESRLS